MYEEYTFVFDIDGTICPIKGKDEDYKDLVPYPAMVEKLQWYKERGARIVLFTSRNMNSYRGNLGIINKNTARVLLDWLDKWEIPYDELFYGKPWPGHKGFYVDDRAIRPDEFMKYNTEELTSMCLESRLRNIDVVITMGGIGSRFRNAGYDEPKYMIEVNGKTLFEWSMMSLQDFYKVTERIIFIALRDDKYDVEEFIKNKCAALRISDYRIIVLDELTDGQATTALSAKKYWRSDNGLLIYNIDTYVEPGAMLYDELHGDGFIPCFQAPGTHWSFVRLDDTGQVAEIKEKERISNYCTLGAYYFRTCALYDELYHEFYIEKGNSVKGERYVAPLYDYLLKKNGRIYISDIPADKVHVLGTPEELQKFINEYHKNF